MARPQPEVHDLVARRERARERMHAAEITALFGVLHDALLDFLRCGVGVGPELLGAVLGELRDRGLRGVPVARTVHVKIRGQLAEVPESVTKQGGRFAGLHATEFDAPVLQAAIGGFRGRR